MKTLLILTLLVPFSGFSRNHSDDEVLNYLKWGSEYIIGYQWESGVYAYTDAKVVIKNKVHTIISYRVKKNGKREIETKKTFNQFGKLIQLVDGNETTDYVFSGDLLTEIIRTKKGTIWRTTCAYDDEKRVVSIRKMKNEKLLMETTYAYFEGLKTTVVEQKNFDGKKRVYRYETDYDVMLKRPTESRYLINGKLDKKWTYSCDEKGKVEKSAVEEVTQCSYTAANNDGSYIVFSRTIEDKEIYLQETTFNKDSVCTEYKRFYNDTVLVSHQVRVGNTSTYEAFKKKGKFMSKSISEYDERGNYVNYAYYNKRSKVTSSMKAKYMDNDLIQEVEYKSGTGMTFEYSFY